MGQDGLGADRPWAGKLEPDPAWGIA